MLLMNSVVMGSLMMDTTFCKYGHKTKKKEWSSYLFFTDFLSGWYGTHQLFSL